jgi:protein SCO1
MKTAAIIAVMVWPAIGLAHDGVVHQTDDQAAAHIAEGLPLPFDLGGHFTLTDQHGAARSEVDPAGHLQLLFFGYANCQEICSVALPQMAEIASGLAAQDVAVTPVLITVDPVRDTVANMGPAMAKLSPDFVGLTGTDAELAVAYQLFSIESSLVFEDPKSGPVYAHGSFIYLLDGQGKFLTVLPPILSTARMIEIIAGHAAGAAG